ncbi:MAG: hypothetical protein ACKOZU_00900 [Planctomycetaceae bacterium]
MRSTREPRPAGRGGRCGVALAALAITAILATTPAGAAWRDFQRTAPPPRGAAPVVTAPVVEGQVVEGATEVREPAVVVPACAETVGDDAAAAPPDGEDAAEDAAVLPAAAEAADGPCDEEAEACGDALGRLRADTIADVNIDIRVGGRPGSDYPCECRLEGETFQPRRFATTTFTWKAAGYCHKPLYFEHWNLERYGHSHGFVADSFLSAAHFFARIPALPYELGVELPWECVYPLGYYRPGNCAPWTVPAVPVSGRGFAVGAAAATGIVFILP